MIRRLGLQRLLGMYTMWLLNMLSAAPWKELMALYSHMVLLAVGRNIPCMMRIHYLVKDKTGSASVIFWDKLAVQLVKKTASELIHLLKKDDNFPDELDLPVGKNVLLKLKLNDYNKKHPASSISVTQYTICEDLLNQFNEANAEGIVERVDAQNVAQNISVNPVTEGVTPLITPLEDSSVSDLSQHATPAPIKGKRRISNKRNVVILDDLTTTSHVSSIGFVEERVSKVIKQEK